MLRKVSALLLRGGAATVSAQSLPVARTRLARGFQSLRSSHTQAHTATAVVPLAVRGASPRAQSGAPAPHTARAAARPNRGLQLKDVAHISFEGGGLILPVRTPYQHEVLMEHLEVSTKRHGAVRLDLHGRRWNIAVNDGPAEPCTTCTLPADNVTYRFEARSLCRPCASDALR